MFMFTIFRLIFKKHTHLGLKKTFWGQNSIYLGYDSILQVKNIPKLRYRT